ncbi:hypothetical protein [Trinickia sp. Y13]|uniref:hypothetical protein n=1 Tax=Trinickia sp. Y13 TaxID=2917807 RepID=UPI002405A9E6|nr:hypothetical protein [Trinickia sp. Y13]MDG0024056.1 hypothetical protein [Trinickia sp. Y13]
MNPTSRDLTELDAHLCAYNMAFAELGLRFRWDVRTLASLAGIEDERERIVAYIQMHQPHLLTAYSANFLSRAILEKKNELRPEPPCVRHAVALETNRPSVVQVRAREPHPATDFPLPMLAGA